MTQQLLEKAIIESCYEDDVAAFADLIEKRQRYLSRIESELFEQPDDTKLKQFRRGQSELQLLKRIASLIIQLAENDNDSILVDSEIEMNLNILDEQLRRTQEFEALYLKVAVEKIYKCEELEGKLNRYQQHFIQQLNNQQV